MRKITDIYKEYKITPALQLHQLRVAAVASLICDNFTELLPKDDIVAACLLHDMGNIIKFKLDVFPEFLEPEGVEYWQKVQDEFKEKYGSDEHKATIAIAAELQVSQNILNLIDAVGFTRSIHNVEHEDFAKKICCYSDMRVVPHGVASIENRFMEGEKRYPEKQIQGEQDKYRNAIRTLEKQILTKCKIKPEDIRDDSVKPIIERLKDFEI